MQRREFLKRAVTTGTAAAWSLQSRPSFAADDDKLPVAGVTTVYRRHSHADVLLGKILEGYWQQGGPGPGLKLVSMYVDQFPKNDASRRLADKHGVPIFDSIEGAMTIGGDSIPVAGVLSIGEHGDYPYTEKTRQHMYPRRRFFDEIAATFGKYGKVVPVFSDKHLSWNWADARHMYETANRMRIPMMAGSSLPVAWRKPPLKLPLGCRIEQAVAVGYGGPESYGFHALETLQCMVERRKGGETGVKSVQAVQGEGIWQAEKDGWWSRELLESVLSMEPRFPGAGWEKRLNEETPFYLIEYRDGLRATVAMANGVSRNFGFAAQIKGQSKPAACRFALEDDAPYGHFGYLLDAIEHMVRAGKPAYPVERTLLTTGILDRLMHSLAENNKQYATPELDIRYKPVDWPFATGPVGTPPNEAKRRGS